MNAEKIAASQVHGQAFGGTDQGKLAHHTCGEHQSSSHVPRSSAMHPLRLAVLHAVWFWVNLGSAAEPLKLAGVRQQEFPGLRNVFKLDRHLYSGSLPYDESAFAALAAAGVKLIISVDGAKPSVALAKQHGMRYVHLPIGYESIPKKRVTELIKAASQVDGPIYIHCHHGKHRGPAAAAVVCLGLRDWTPDEAGQWLQQAGTSPDYGGLYRDIRGFQKPDASALAGIPESFPEIAPTPRLVDMMVAIDDRLELLKRAQADGWHRVPGHPDLAPSQLATLLWEDFRELQRNGGNHHEPDYRNELRMAENSAATLAAALKTSKLPHADDALKRVSADCTHCHKAHRN